MRRAILLVAAIVGITVIAPLGASSGPVDSADCEIPWVGDLADGQEPTPEGWMPFQEWLARPAAQSSVELIADDLKASFGAASEKTALEGGLLGTAIDHTTQTVFVVVDTTLVDEALLEATLQANVAKAWSDTGSDPINVEVRQGCNSSQTLLNAEEIATDAASEEGSDVSFYVDPHTSTLVLQPTDPEKADEIADDVGSQVDQSVAVVDHSVAESLVGGRASDAEPHLSGAGIRPASVSGNNCTSGFSVVGPNGNEGSVTAAHCFAESGAINGRDVKSMSEHYGVSAGASNFPNYDMVRINGEGDDFQAKIYANPPSGDVNTVTSGGDPVVGAIVCTSGKTTLAVCGAEVTQVNVSKAADFGTSIHLFKMVHPGGTFICAGGDSGGPVYKRQSQDDARARGIIVIGTRSGADTCWAHLWATVRNHLNINLI